MAAHNLNGFHEQRTAKPVNGIRSNEVAPNTSTTVDSIAAPPPRPWPNGPRAAPNGEHAAATAAAAPSQSLASGHSRQPSQHHQYYHYPPPSSSASSSASFKGCCCCLFLFLAFVGLLALAVVLVIVLAVKPKKPQFDLQEVSVQYIGLSSPSGGMAAVAGGGGAVSSASLSLRIGMIFTAGNGNKVGIKYGESGFTVMYRGVPLGRALVPGFYQPAHSVRRVSTTVAVDRVNLMQADAADLIKDALVDDRVELRILGDVGAKIRILGLTSPAVQVSVDCAIVISPKKQSLTYKQCGFDGLNV